MAKRANWRAIKRHRNYNVDEAARALNVAKGTIRRWIKDGLPAITDKKPALIMGADLIEFLKARKPKKQKLLINELLCFSCKVPRHPAFGEVEYIISNTKSGSLRALCEVCTTVMHKRISRCDADQLKTRLIVIERDIN